jgi:hypothetical protein
VYPWVPWALTTASRLERSASLAYRLPSPSWLRRATNRSNHLGPLADLGYLSRPERHQIYPSEVPVRLHYSGYNLFENLPAMGKAANRRFVVTYGTDREFIQVVPR